MKIARDSYFVEFEVYDKTGKTHQGTYDADTGKKKKDGVPGRRIKK